MIHTTTKTHKNKKHLRISQSKCILRIHLNGSYFINSKINRAKGSQSFKPSFAPLVRQASNDGGTNIGGAEGSLLLSSSRYKEGGGLGVFSSSASSLEPALVVVVHDRVELQRRRGRCRRGKGRSGRSSILLRHGGWHGSPVFLQSERVVCAHLHRLDRSQASSQRKAYSGQT